MKIPYNEYRYLSEEQYLDLLNKLNNSTSTEQVDISKLEEALNKEIADRIADVNDVRNNDKVVKSASYNPNTNILTVIIANDEDNPIEVNMVDLLLDADILRPTNVTYTELVSLKDNSQLESNRTYRIDKEKHAILIKALSTSELDVNVKLINLNQTEVFYKDLSKAKACYNVDEDCIYDFTDYKGCRFYNFYRKAAIDLDNLYVWYSEYYEKGLICNTEFIFGENATINVSLGEYTYITNSKFQGYDGISISFDCVYMLVDHVQIYSFNAIHFTYTGNSVINTRINLNAGEVVISQKSGSFWNELFFDNSVGITTTLTDCDLSYAYLIISNTKTLEIPNLVLYNSRLNLVTDKAEKYPLYKIRYSDLKITDASNKYFKDTDPETVPTEYVTKEFFGVHVTEGGTASQFLKGDGSLDSTEYLPKSTYQEGLNSFNDKITQLQGEINTESDARSRATTALQNDIDTEEQARIEKDTELQNAIDNEATLRQNAYTTARVSIDNEATARESADATLQTNIDAANKAISDERTRATNAENLKYNIADDVWIAATVYAELSSIDSTKTYFITEL